VSAFTTLREANVARQKEWDFGDLITPAYRANELAGEMGEACNVIKKLERERLAIRGSRATVDQLAEELADVVICVDLVAMKAGCDLQLGTGHSVGHTTAAGWGAELAVHVGRLCDCVLFLDKIAIGASCQKVERTARAIAALYRIDLDAAIARKFNATSEKVGLRTRMLTSERAA
jgi:NTP pyrophosphatase (non-canonical NTP hydrolase)